MKGLLRKAVALLSGALALAGTQGCYYYRELVDPCYPDRYEYEAAKNLDGAFEPQVENGHVLDQTIWNYHFEAGTDKLTYGGLEHLAYLARRRPHPDPIVYLQTAQSDLSYDPANPDKLTEARRDLDSKREAAILKYLGAQTSGRPVEFKVVVHDPAEVYLPSVPANGAYELWVTTRPRGGLPTSGSSGATSGGGGGGAAGGSR